MTGRVGAGALGVAYTLFLINTASFNSFSCLTMLFIILFEIAPEIDGQFSLLDFTIL